MDSVLSPLDLAARGAPEGPVAIARPHRVGAAALWFKQHFPGEVFYAVKANPSPWVLDALVANGVTNFDVASETETQLIASRYPQARIAFMHPVRKVRTRHFGNLSDPCCSASIRESTHIRRNRFLTGIKSEHRLVLIELLGVRVDLVNDENLFRVGMLADVNVHMVTVDSLSAFDIALMRRHLDTPRLAIRILAAACGTFRVLDGDVETVQCDVSLAVVAGLLLLLGGVGIHLGCRLLYGAFCSVFTTCVCSRFSSLAAAASCGASFSSCRV